MPAAGLRRRAMATGVAVAVGYLALAALSGHLSPLARRPLLDGLPTPVPYRWVTPPPELAATNVEPTAADVTLALRERGSEPEILTTDDAQLTLIFVAGTFPAAPGQRAVHVAAEPLDASAVDPPAEPLDVVGNVYRVRATYEPSGRPITAVEEPIETILVYPLPPNVHATTHSVIASADGSSWSVAEGTDSPGNQQTEGPVRTLGYVAVGGDLRPGGAGASPIPTERDNSTLGIALIVGAVCMALVGIGLLLRGR